MVNSLPLFAKMPASIANAPALFHSLRRGAKVEYVTCEFQSGNLSYRLVGPRLGLAELRVLQGLNAIAVEQYYKSLNRRVESLKGPEPETATLDQIDTLLAQSLQVSTSYNHLARTTGYADNCDEVNEDMKQALEKLFSVVSAEVILTHCAEVKMTHLGDHGGLLRAADVDSGASSGDTSNGPKGRERQRDRAAVGLFAQHGAQVPA